VTIFPKLFSVSYSPNAQRVSEAYFLIFILMKITISSLARDGTQQFFDNEIEAFLALHDNILKLPETHQLRELREKWTLSKFCTLVEMLIFLEQSDREILLPRESETSPEIFAIRNSIFEPHNTEALFHKFIRPKARIDETVEYGYDDFEKSRFANLTTHSDEVYEKIQLFLEGDFLVPTENHSAERLRRERKLSLDLFLTALFKFGSV